MPQPCPSIEVVNATKAVFGELGIPQQIISDNGPHFASAEYKRFTTTWGIVHVTSSPRYPRSNGFVERQIRTVKSVMTKAKQSGQDITLALLSLRTTPLDSKLPSPAELLHGRKLQGNLITRIPNSRLDQENIQERLTEKQEKMKEYHDRTARGLPPLYKGQAVLFQLEPGGKWRPAEVDRRCEEPRSYVINTPSGQLRRNRAHIREVPQPNTKRLCFAEPEVQDEDAIPPVRPPQDGAKDNRGPPVKNTSNAQTTQSPKKSSKDTPQTSTTTQRNTDSQSSDTQPVSESYRTRSGRSVKTPKRFDD